MYQALYRRFRPKTFDEVLGQEHITTTLKNQIVKGNIGHAYVFSGTRGTGKTSTAKIFARAVNCLHTEDGNPCNSCEVCKDILDENVMDVIEMDAASNNSVDDVRELREKVKYPPSKGRYKVYIIDEVHMLSKGAFNALLKTLEEPPKHLIFILATTEVEKLPQTILSRCQRFDFKRITTKDIVKNMKNICGEIGVDVDDKVLNLIARNSDGAMRDALSLLDQCISFKEGKLTLEDALQILGITNNDIIFEMVDSIKARDIEKSLHIIDEIMQKGKDVNQFIKDLLVHYRNLMIVKTSTNPSDIIDFEEETIERYKEQVQDVSLPYILNALKILNQAENSSKWSSQPRIVLEMAVVKLIDSIDISSLEERIDKLEEAIQSGSMPKIEKRETVQSQKKEKKAEKIEVEEKKEEKGKSQENSEEVIAQNSIIDDGKDMDLETVKKEWSNFMKELKKQRISLQALLAEGKILSMENGVLTIGFAKGFGIHKEAVSKKGNKEYIEKALASYFNKNIRVQFVMEDEFGVEDIKNDEEKENERLVKQVTDLFGEDLVEIKK
jgi:DNA polymerase-3 subunit gamma/tau